MKSQISKFLVAAAVALPIGAISFSSHAASSGSLTGPYRSEAGQLEKIHPGLTQGEVRMLAGRPDSTMANTNAHAGKTDWTYSFVDTWGYRSEFDVTFDARGLVESTFSKRFDD